LEGIARSAIARKVTAYLPSSISKNSNWRPVSCCSPFVALLFMSGEYGQTAPLQCFVGHGDAPLMEGVCEGRTAGFVHLGWNQNIRDAQFAEIFRRSHLNWSLRDHGKHLTACGFGTELLSLRRSIPAPSKFSKKRMKASPCGGSCLLLERCYETERIFAAFNFGEQTRVRSSPGAGVWRQIVDSAETRWDGPSAAAPESFEVNESATVEMPAFLSLFRHSTQGDLIDSAG
jgi:maltooligosyltrehalose trehalohydrolase